MPWTDITRPQYVRHGCRYASDCTNAEWALIEPFMPRRKKTGRPRTTELRDVWDAIQYMAATGCQWAMIPNDFPPRSTIQRYFYDWRDSAVLHQINHAVDQPPVNWSTLIYWKWEDQFTGGGSPEPQPPYFPSCARPVSYGAGPE